MTLDASFLRLWPGTPGRWARCVWALGLLAAVHAPAATSSTTTPSMLRSALPARDLTVELREIDEAHTDGAVRTATQPRVPLLPAHKIQVRNGQQGMLRIQQSVPMLWVQSVQSQDGALQAGDAPASQRGASVRQSLQWLEQGLTLLVTPRWPGGNRDASVEVDVQQAQLLSGSQADAPQPMRSQVRTTLTLPLGRWVTLAATAPPGAGGASVGVSTGPDAAVPAAAGSYSSEGSAATVRRWLQLRLLAP